MLCDTNLQASCSSYRLVVRDVATLQITHLYTCLDAIQYLEVREQTNTYICFRRSNGEIVVNFSLCTINTFAIIRSFIYRLRMSKPSIQ